MFLLLYLAWQTRLVTFFSFAVFIRVHNDFALLTHSQLSMTFCTIPVAQPFRRTLVVALLLLLPTALAAQITLSGSGAGGAIVVEQEPPFLVASIKAAKNNVPFVLTKDNFLVIERNFSSTPEEISLPQDGFQKVKWRYKNYRVSPRRMSIRFLAFENSTIGEAFSSLSDTTLPYMTFQAFIDQKFQQIREYDFGTVASGSQTTKTIQIRPINGIKLPNGQDDPFRVDSMVVQGTGFTATWKGNFVTTRPPPVEVISSFPYDIDVTFTAPDNNFHRGVITVYYHSGFYTQLLVRANAYTIPDVPALKLITPNGNENFAPCEDIPIQWEGSIPSLPTIAEYSLNGGRDWKFIGSSAGKTLLWRVPAEFSDSVLIRVRQELAQSNITTLSGPDFPVHSIAFHPDGSKLLAGYASTDIVEWDVARTTKIQEFSLSVTDPLGRTPVIGVGYTKDNNIAAAFRSVNGITTLAFFTSGSPLPVSTVQLPTTYKARSMEITPDGTQLFVVPEQGAQLFVYSATDGAFVRTVTLSAPINAISFSPNTNTLGVALLNNTIELLSLDNYATIKTIVLSTIPIVNQLALSVDNSFIAIATQVSQPTLVSGIESEVHVLDGATGTIIRTLRDKSASNSVGLSFSSTARFLAIGSAGTPQVSLWNLFVDSFSGAFEGHSNVLTDIQFSKVGTSLATSSNDKQENLRLRSFSFPESDNSDTLAHIIRPTVAATTPVLPIAFIGTQFDTVLTASFCNSGIVPVVLTKVRFEKGTAFQLLSPFVTDTLHPGECITFKLAFAPQDTGLLEDKLIYSTCNSEFALPLQARSRNRTIAFMADELNFASICAGTTTERFIDFLRNDDPIPLTVNSIEVFDPLRSPFTILTPVRDTILQPGETLRLRVRFSPQSAGEDRRLFRIFHSNQRTVFGTMHLLGYGLGAEIALSSNDVRFLPERLTRTIALENKSDVDVTIDSIAINPSGAFSVVSGLPVVIPAKGTVSLEVRWSGEATNDAQMSAFFTPCALPQTATLGEYKGHSTLSIPIVRADPRGSASIPIRFSTVENRPYNDSRVFETEFSVHPGLFLPQSVHSDYGTAMLIRNDIVGNRRIVGIRVEGSFPQEGVAAIVTGPAGLAEVTTSSLAFPASQQPWGKAVITSFEEGELRLTGVCDELRLTKTAALSVQALYPNPAQKAVTLEFTASIAEDCAVYIVDPLGQTIGEIQRVNAVEGQNSMQVVLPPLSDGSYRLVLRQGVFSTSVTLAVRNK